MLAGNQLLANGVRLHNFDEAAYPDYDTGSPPPARQSNPSVAADIQLEGIQVSGGYLYLAWEDDRRGNPQQEKDIYFARTNLTFANQPPYGGYSDGAGSQISNVLDSGRSNTTWYSLSWTGETPNATYITVQTRLGNTLAEVLAGEWYPRRYPYQPQAGDCNALLSGAPLAGHDASGQHIEDAAGQKWPQARYIQYRVNFYSRDSRQTPLLNSITLYYSAVSNSETPKDKYVYLPLVLK